MAHIIVLGNEKGGTGKSTVAMNITSFLLYRNFKVATIDVDARQGTFTRYVENRKNYIKNHQEIIIPISDHTAIFKESDKNIEESERLELEKFKKSMEDFKNYDFIIIDTPGNNTFLSQLAHSYADTLITPLNDSFIDLDVLVRVTNGDMKSLRPSVYAEMVWNQRKERAKMKKKPIDWVVVRNRLITLDTRNRRDVNVVLEALSKRIGFRLGSGFCERVVFKELFLSGLTLLDLEDSGTKLNLSHVSARQELREFLNFLRLPKV